MAATIAAAACSNNPYPDADKGRKVLYSSFNEAPKTLDPAVAYTTDAHVVTANVYDTLLEYHFLRRPYTLIPGLGETVPQPQRLADGREVYHFKVRAGVLFHADPCFTLSQPGRLTREVVAADFAFEIARLADPAVNSPVASGFELIAGFVEFAKRLTALRDTEAGFRGLAVHEQYQRAGGIEGVVVQGTHDLEIVLKQQHPQILFWFAMPFTTAVPWEAVAYYTGSQGRPHFADHPVGTGPYRLAIYDKQHRIVLERNTAWYGTLQPLLQAPGATFPTEIEAEDIAEGRIDPAYAGTRLPFIDAIHITRERESIPRFNKFLQGYYDDTGAAGIVKESFDAVVQGDRLSPEMAARGMRLSKTVEPSIFYIGFNLDDPVVGHMAGDRSRKLRQAMSLAIDSVEYLSLFLNGRGLPAQSILPPGIFGYDAAYLNPFRKVDLAAARRLLAEAGYPGGIDPDTHKPLKLSFDSSATTAQALLQFQYYVAAWQQLGIDVEVKATNYNQFQEKIRRGAYQLFSWGWTADFPDPENFFFLMECRHSRSRSGGENVANFCNAEYDRLYQRMKDQPNSPERAELVRGLIAILERERPWIELYHLEDYELDHAWLANAKPMGLSYPTFKYKDVKPRLRAERQAEWNRPVRWPLYLMLLAGIAAVVPAVRTFYRERQ